jgi:preprotein translocase subunit SecD
MRKLLLLFVFTAALAGCSPKSTAMKLPPGMTMELYFVAAAGDPNTIPATDPDTGGPLLLQASPIVTTADIETVARSATEVYSSSGKLSDPAFTVKLTPAGSAKLAAATATPAGQKLAVVINHNVIFAPTLRSPIQSGTFEISGGKAIAYVVEALTTPQP